MPLLFILVALFSHNSFADIKKTCTIEDGIIADKKFTLQIYNDRKNAIFTDNVENKMICKSVDKDRINRFLKQYDTAQPATDKDLIYYCLGSSTFSISVITPENTGKLYISKFAFNITCK